MNAKKHFAIGFTMLLSFGMIVSCELRPSGHTHEYNLVDEVPATCTKDGVKAHYECEGCDKIFDAEKNEVTLEELAIAAHHTLTHVDSLAATCTENGHIEYYTCSVCGKYFSEGEGQQELTADDLVIQAHGHHLVKHDEHEATCTEAGNTAYWSCEDCGKYFSDAEGHNEIADGDWVIAAAHVLTAHEAVAKTCTTAGNIAYWSCSKCGKFYSDDEGHEEIANGSWVIPASHELEHHAATETSCDHDGNSEYWHCTACDKYFSDENAENEISKDSTVIPAIPHTISSYSYNEETGKILAHCSVCNTDSEITPTKYVERLPFYAASQDAVQFSSGELKDYIDDGSGTTQTCTILNLDTGYSSSIYPGQKELHYFGDDSNKPIGFWHAGMFAGIKQGDTLEFKNLIFTYGDNYYVIGYAGTVYSETIGNYLNINGEIKDYTTEVSAYGEYSMVNIAAEFTTETNYWDLTGNDIGETWTKWGGTNFKVDVVKSGVTENHFTYDSSSDPAGPLPAFQEVTLRFNAAYWKIQQLRIGFPNTGLNPGDKYIIRAGATFTDTARHAVILREDLEFIFNGSTINLYLGDVDLSNSEPTNWGSPYSFRSETLKFDFTNRNSDGNVSDTPCAGFGNFSKISFELTDTDGNKSTNVTEIPNCFYMPGTLIGMQGKIAFDGHTFAVGDIVTIPDDSYITVGGIGTYHVSVGVSMRIIEINGSSMNWEVVK